MKDYKQLREQRMAVNEKLGDLYAKAANRELTDEEKMTEINLSRELSQCEAAMRAINLDEENAKTAALHASENTAANFREYLKGVRSGKSDREITLLTQSPANGASITESGAINLSIKDIIPTLTEGLGLPKGLNIVTGVIGNELWPVSINDVEMEEVGEVAPLTDQALTFANIVPTVARVGLTVPVSNRAIDNAAFDLLSFVQAKFAKAQAIYLAKKIYSQGNFSGNKGPFGGMTAGTITLGKDAYKNILKAVAAFTDKGFIDGNVCISMDATTEAELKATPKAEGQGGFVIENGTCAGYPYTVSHFVNTTLDDGSVVPTADRYLEIGYWDYFALQQHDDVRLTVDATSQAVAKKGITAITLNTAWSMTDLSKKINGANNASQAFGLYKILVESESV